MKINWEPYATYLKNRFPNIKVETRESGKDFCFINIYFDDGFEIAVEYHNGVGYGLSCFTKDSHPLDGWCCQPQETYDVKPPYSVDNELNKRIISLIKEHGGR